MTGQGKTLELHNFADASTFGYGQCSYLKVKDEDDNVNVALVMGKSRVAPSKIITIYTKTGAYSSGCSSKDWCGAKTEKN